MRFIVFALYPSPTFSGWSAYLDFAFRLLPLLVTNCFWNLFLQPEQKRDSITPTQLYKPNFQPLNFMLSSLSDKLFIFVYFEMDPYMPHDACFLLYISDSKPKLLRRRFYGYLIFYPFVINSSFWITVMALFLFFAWRRFLSWCSPSSQNYPYTACSATGL